MYDYSLAYLVDVQRNFEYEKKKTWGKYSLYIHKLMDGGYYNNIQVNKLDWIVFICKLAYL